MMRMGVWFLAGCLACVVHAPRMGAQFVSGDWVERGEAKIREARTTPVSFLVLDAEGRLVPGAEVRVEQQNHAFTLGFVVHDSFPERFDADAEGWRVFNAVSLEAMTSWRQMQPSGPDDLARGEMDRVIAAARAAGLRVRWGSLVSAEAFDLPEWVVPLRGETLLDAMRSYAQRMALAYAQDIDELDAAEHTLGHDRLSPAMLRLLAMDLHAAWPGAAVSVRYEQALAGARTFEVVSAMDDVLKQRLGIDAFTIDHSFPPREIAQDLLEPAVQRLAKVGGVLNVGSLEIGATHGIEAAVNSEIVLRTLFAEPAVTGIYFSGLTDHDTADPSAALFDHDATPTAIARTADRLFRETWWSDETLTTNALGQATTRVFRGDYVVTATLPDGSTVTAPLGLRERDEESSEIILMPVAE